jgi:hypothetical protein
MIKGELSFSSRRHGKKTIINKTKERKESGMKGRKAKKKRKERGKRRRNHPRDLNLQTGVSE